MERSGESEDQGFLPPEPAGPEPELGDRPPQPPPAPQARSRRRSSRRPTATAAATGTAIRRRLRPATATRRRRRPGLSAASARLRLSAAAAVGISPAVRAGQRPGRGRLRVLARLAAGCSSSRAASPRSSRSACAIVGIVCSRKGKKKVDAGETPKHRGLAQAGFIIGWVSLVLSILATVAWTLVLAFAIADDDFNWDTDPTPSRRPRSPRGGATHRGLTLFSAVRAESLRQAVSDDRRPDAAAARRVAGDGRADGLPPGARLRRGLRARAEAPQGPLPDARTRSRSSRRPAAGRSSPRSRTSCGPGEPALVASCGKFGERWFELCEAYGARDDPLGDRVGAQGRPGRARPRCWARTSASSSSSRPSPRPPPAW